MSGFYLADGTRLDMAPKVNGSPFLSTSSSLIGPIIGVADEDMPVIR